jgi:hypothetical protein
LRDGVWAEATEVMRTPMASQAERMMAPPETNSRAFYSPSMGV